MKTRLWFVVGDVVRQFRRMTHPTEAAPFQPADADCRGEKIRQYPRGLMVPSTIRQLLGGWKFTHLLHCLSPFG